MRRMLICISVCAYFQSSVLAEPFELKDGDKVVWLGSTLIEREQRYGYWETALTARWPNRNITFRNLGWSGDNVFGEARLAFDINNPALGLKRMVDLTLAEKPTVIFICFGTNESFEGEAGLEKFQKGYEKLLDALAPAKARIVLMTPLPFEKSSLGLPDPTEANRRLEVYCSTIRKLVDSRKLTLADLNQSVSGLTKAEANPRLLTDNGVHLTEKGYEWTTEAFGAAFDFETDWLKKIAATGTESLRQTIIDKNQLYFYRWRPQNETYLFGFRKHEQGRNAKEVAEFDPLISAKEKEIAKLRVPKSSRQ